MLQFSCRVLSNVQPRYKFVNNTLLINAYVCFALPHVLARLSGILHPQEVTTLCVHIVEFEVVNVKYDSSWLDTQKLQLTFWECRKSFILLLIQVFYSRKILPNEVLACRISEALVLNTMTLKMTCHVES